MWILLFLLSTHPAQALSTSPHALRLEDKKEGNALIGAEKAVIERGEIYHDVVLLWGQLDIYGEVDEVILLGGHATFHEGSQLKKSLVVMGGSFDSQPGAALASENVVAKLPGPLWSMLKSAGNLWRDHFDGAAKILAGIASCFLAWLAGWLLFYASPGLQKKTADVLMKEWPKHLALGFLGSTVACGLFMMLVISFVGWILIPFYLVFLLVAAWISYSAAALWAGHRLLPPKPGQRLNPWGLLLGFLAFQFFWIVPIWWALIPIFLLWALAWGALVRSMKVLWK